MPEYSYTCPQCGHNKKVIHTIKECDTLGVICIPCRDNFQVVVMQRGLCVPTIKGDGIYPFYLNNIREKGEKYIPGKGVLVNDKEEHEALMKRHKCVTPYLHESKAEDALVGKGGDI